MLRLRLVLCLVASAAISCTELPPEQSTRGEGRFVGLTFLTREGCANTPQMRAHLDEALRSLGLPSDYLVVDLGTVSDADARRGYPTPTLLYANRDVFGLPEPKPPLPEPT